MSAEQQTVFQQNMEILKPRDLGPITGEEAALRAAQLADDVQGVDLQRDVEVIATTWEEGARFVDENPESEPAR